MPEVCDWVDSAFPAFPTPGVVASERDDIDAKSTVVVSDSDDNDVDSSDLGGSTPAAPTEVEPPTSKSPQIWRKMDANSTGEGESSKGMR